MSGLLFYTMWQVYHLKSYDR